MNIKCDYVYYKESANLSVVARLCVYIIMYYICCCNYFNRTITSLYLKESEKLSCII